MTALAYTLWPGSTEAQANGCECAVLDNGHGSIALARDRGGWWIVNDCPLHGEGGTDPAPIPERDVA